MKKRKKFVKVLSMGVVMGGIVAFIKARKKHKRFSRIYSFQK